MVLVENLCEFYHFAIQKLSLPPAQLKGWLSSIYERHSMLMLQMEYVF